MIIKVLRLFREKLTLIIFGRQESMCYFKVTSESIEITVILITAKEGKKSSKWHHKKQWGKTLNRITKAMDHKINPKWDHKKQWKMKIIEIESTK